VVYSGVSSSSMANLDRPALEADRLDDEVEFLAGRLRVPLGGVGQTSFRDSGLSSRPRTELWLCDSISPKALVPSKDQRTETMGVASSVLCFFLFLHCL